jgi:hypothetical protein
MDEQVYRFWELERNAARGSTPFIVDYADLGNLSPFQRSVQLDTPQADLVGKRY